MCMLMYVPTCACVLVCVCVCVCLCVCVHWQVCVFSGCVRSRTWVCLCVRGCSFVYEPVCERVYACVCTCMYEQCVYVGIRVCLVTIVKCGKLACADDELSDRYQR